MPLPPISLDDYRRFAIRKFEETTQPLINDLRHSAWSLDAQALLDDTARQVRSWFPAPPPVAPPPPPPSEEPGFALEAAGEPMGPPAPDLGQRLGMGAQAIGTAVGDTAGDWASRAQQEIAALGAQVAGGFQQAQQAPLPSLEAPSTWEPSTPWEQVGALASRVPRGAVEPVQDVIGRVQRTSAGTSGALQGLGLPEGLAGVAGFGAGVLGTPGAVMGGSVQSAAERAGIPEAELQGDIADILAPVPGTRFGALSTPRLAGLAGGAAVGAGVGALTAEEDDRGRGALKGAALGAQLGPGAVDVLSRVPYRFGRAATEELAPEAASGIRRGQGFRMPALTPEQQAQRARDGAAEQRVFDAISRLWRTGQEEAADDLRFLAVGKGEAGEAAAREYLAGKGLAEVLPLAPAPLAEEGAAGVLSRAAAPLMARAAQTPGEAAVDLGVGTASGLYGAATADEDATPQERALRGLGFAALGAPAGAHARQLARVGGRAFGEEALGIAGRDRGLGPAEREALRRAVASGRAVPPEVVEAVRRAEGDEAAARVAADAIETASEELAKATAAGASPAQLSRMARTLNGALEVFNSWTLGGIFSLLTNATGGATQTVLNVGEAVGAGGLRGGLAYTRAAAGALGGAGRDAWRVFLEGTQAGGETLGRSVREQALPGGLSEGRGAARTLATAPVRANAATDRAVYTINEAGGRALGESLGYSGTQLDDFARRYAEEATYAGDPSKLGQVFVDARRALTDPDATPAQRAWGAFVYATTPYIRVPERILRQGLDLGTGGLIHLPELRSSDPAVQAAARGRMGVALTTTLGLAGYAWNGGLTGDGPPDEGDREALEAQTLPSGDPAWRRNSLRVDVPGAGPGGTARRLWVPTRTFGAVGQQMDLVANFVEAYQRETERTGGDVGQGFMQGAVAGLNSAVATALGDSWLRELVRLGGRVERKDFTGAALDVAGGLAGRPLAPLAGVARALDPYEREVTRADPLERVLERVPFARERLPARIDPATGEPVRAGGTAAERVFTRQPVRPSTVQAELLRLRSLTDARGERLYPGVALRTFDDPQVTYAGVVQDEAGTAALRRAFGSETNRYLGAVIADPRYQRATDAEKASMVADALGEAAVRADAAAGSRIQRDAKSRANYEYLAVPHYEGILPSAGPDAIRKYNLDVADAKQQLARYRARYPDNPNRGQTEFYRDQPAMLALALKPARDATALRRQREEIARRVGVAPDETGGAVTIRPAS